MYDKKPLMGWGPGTYMFQYAAFQKSSEATIITVNDGSNGNAHSEYLGPLSEQGIPGILMVVLLMFSIFFTGFRLVYSVVDKKLKYICVGILMGLTTYFVHGFLNNFLDTDKLSVPFWGFITILICIDIYHKKTEKLDYSEG
jgi:O-antigen ligase